MKPRALISFGKLAVALALTLTSNILLPDTSWAQIGVFASVEGLQCSSTDVSFPGAIIVRSLSGGVSAGSGGGGGGSGGQPVLAPLKTAKDFDQCSPLLFRAAVVGQAFARVTITFVKEGGSRFAFFVIELTNAMVQDMTIGANDALAQTSEEVSFTFQRIKLTDILIDATGKPVGTVVVECDFKALKCT
jgi:type VI secretion system Hcp family effector